MKNQGQKKNSCIGRIYRLILFILIALSLFVSCNNEKNKPIPDNDLVDILTEIYVANGLLAIPPVRTQFSYKDSTANYQDIIQSHGYTKERMDKTIRHYFEKKPKKLENIYDQVLTRLNEKQALLEKDIAPKVVPELWTGPTNIAVPESGINDPVWFSIPIKDTGNYMLDFTTVVYSDDQSLNPKVIVFFWHADSSKTGFRINWPGLDLPKDGQWHNYLLSKRNSDTTITHISGWLLDSDPKGGRWEKHAKIEKIRLRKGTLE
jgi:hypothetical protein